MQTIVSIVMSDLIPLRSRGTWQGIVNLVWAAGMATGAPLGGLLADTIGWRWAFLIQVPMTILALILVSVALKLPSPESSHWKDQIKRIDFGGAFTLVISLVALLYGLDRGGNIAWKDSITITSLSIFVAFFSAFVGIELGLAKEPFAPKRIVINPSLIAAYLCNFFCVAAVICLVFYLSLYVQAVQHMTAAEAGLSLIPSIVGGVLGSLTGGYIIQLTGRYYVLTIVSFAWMLLGVVVINLSTGVVVHSYVGLEIGLFITAAGNGSGITTTLIALISQAGASDQAIATAVSYLFRSLGSVLGLSIGSTIFQGRLRHVLTEHLHNGNVDEIVRRVREALSYIDELDPDTRVIVRGAYESSLQTTFWFATAVAGCGVLSSFFIREKALAHKRP